MGLHTRRLAVVGALLLVGLVGCTGVGQPADHASGTDEHSLLADRAAQSQEAIDTRIMEGEPGCSAAVGVEGDVIWQGVRGVADLDTKAPITPETVFEIGSVSKQFTALAILMLQSDGKLSTTDRLSEHVKALPRWARTVTLAQLMHHTSGIPNYVPLLVQHNLEESDRVTNAQSLRVLNDVTELASKPGSIFEYSNSNYLLLAEVVRQVSGVPLPRYLRENVFEPLGLNMKVDAVGRIPAKAVSYWRDGDEFTHQDVNWEMVGAAGIQTSPTELVRWADSYRTGSPGGAAVLNAQLTGAIPVSFGNGGSATDKGDGYGAGIVESKDGSLDHSGEWAGFQTWFEVSPDRHTSVAISCNLRDIDPAELADVLRSIWF